MKEITGKGRDPDCLHCALAVAVEEYRKSHPDESPGADWKHLAQLLAEMIASGGCATVDELAERLGAVQHGAMHDAWEWVLESARNVVKGIEP